MPKGRKVRVVLRTDCFICNTCGYETASKTGHKLHGKITHGIDIKSESFNIDPTVFECRICKKNFTSGAQLTTHVRHMGHCQL